MALAAFVDAAATVLVVLLVSGSFIALRRAVALNPSGFVDGLNSRCGAYRR